MDKGHWNLTQQNNDLFLHGFNIREILEKYGTPIHIIDENTLRDNISKIKNAFQHHYSKFQLYYSVKTNWVPGILKIINDLQVGAEVISPFELSLARRLGFPSERTIYNGIIKPNDGLTDSIKDPIKLINIDSLREIDDTFRIASDLDKSVDVGLRLCPPWGWEAQFGVSVENGEADMAVEQILERKERLNFKGLLIHTAQGSRSPEMFLKEVDFIFNYARHLKKKYGIVVEVVDLGGGMGTPNVQYMTKAERVLNHFFGRPLKNPDIDNFDTIDNFARKISDRVKEQAQKSDIPLPTLHMEPGRALVSQSQFMILKIFDIRVRGKEKILITDGGKQNCTFPLGYEKHYAFSLTKNNSRKEESYSVVGRICSPGDYVFKNIKLKTVEKDDYLFIMDTGAYFNSYSNNFSFPRPAAVIVNEKEYHLTRERESFDYMLGRDMIAENK